MALIGTLGTLTVGGTAYNVESWSATGSNEVQDVSDVSSANVVRIAGLTSWEMKASFWVDASSPQSSAITVGSTYTLVGKVGATSHTFSGSFIISNVEIENSAKNPVKFQLTGMSTGAVAIS
jgi:hypothetical protein